MAGQWGHNNYQRKWYTNGFYGPDLPWQQDCYLAISMSASLTSAAPLYCSSMPLALLCIRAIIRFFLGKVSLVKV